MTIKFSFFQSKTLNDFFFVKNEKKLISVRKFFFLKNKNKISANLLIFFHLCSLRFDFKTDPLPSYTTDVI